MTDLTPTDLDEVRALVAAASDGPWHHEGPAVFRYAETKGCGGCSGLSSPAHEPACYTHEVADAAPDDAALIAAAPSRMAQMADEIEKLRAEAAAIDAAVSDHVDNYDDDFIERAVVEKVREVIQQGLDHASDRDVIEAELNDARQCLDRDKIEILDAFRAFRDRNTEKRKDAEARAVEAEATIARVKTMLDAVTQAATDVRNSGDPFSESSGSLALNILEIIRAALDEGA